MIDDTAVKGSRILVADDEPQLAELLRILLERAGYLHVVSTTRSDSVLDLYREIDPDLLILDLHMPRPDSFEILEQLKRTLSPTEYFPILVLTGDVRPEAKLRALLLGAKDFLTKPVDPVEAMLRVYCLVHTRLLFREITEQAAIRASR